MLPLKLRPFVSCSACKAKGRLIPSHRLTGYYLCTGCDRHSTPDHVNLQLDQLRRERPDLFDDRDHPTAER